jgi:hypothetical protein
MILFKIKSILIRIFLEICARIICVSLGMFIAVVGLISPGIATDGYISVNRKEN